MSKKCMVRFYVRYNKLHTIHILSQNTLAFEGFDNPYLLLDISEGYKKLCYGFPIIVVLSFR